MNNNNNKKKKKTNKEIGADLQAKCFFFGDDSKIFTAHNSVAAVPERNQVCRFQHVEREVSLKD